MATPTLNDVYSNFLNNADVKVTLEDDSITLNFRVFGKVKDKYWQVVFQCSQILEFDYILDDDLVLERDWLIVLDAFVTQSFDKNHHPIYQIKLITHDYFYLICQSFNWQIIEIDETSYANFFNLF